MRSAAWLVGVLVASGCVKSAPAPTRASLLSGARPTRDAGELEGGAAMGAEFTVDGATLRVSLVPDEPSSMVGAPVWATLVLQNTGPIAATVELSWMGRNALGRPDNYEISVRDERGARLATPDAGPSFGGLSSSVTIAPGAAQRRRLFLNLWADIAQPGTYTFALRTTLATRGASAQAAPLEVRAEATVTMRAQSPSELSAVIAALEARATRLDEEAARSLTQIRDPRVIDALVRLSSRPGSSSTMAYLSALARFDDERSVSAIERALAVSARDLDPARYTTDALREQSAQSLRYSAAVALSECPHPRALAALLSLQRDPNDNIRLAVVHRASRMPPADGAPILRAMQSDRSPLVAGEAQRYLRERR